MPQLVKSPESLRRNIDAYFDNARRFPKLIKDAAKVKKWKCYRAADGSWRFGPSRFVGYENMTPSEYIKRKSSADGGLNGTETEVHLRSLATDVPETSTLHRQLTDALADYLREAGISINKALRFSILGDEIDFVSTASENAEDNIVDALFTLSKTLPPSSRWSLIRRLEAI